MSDPVRDQIRQVLVEHARLPVDASEISDDADLFQAGMTSFTSVNVMLALEDTFNLEFPDVMLKREVFSSVDAIAEALGTLAANAS
jgi:acyl carrier protein